VRRADRTAFSCCAASDCDILMYLLGHSRVVWHKQHEHDRLKHFIIFHRYLSRDRNIVQFYGACVQSSSMLLVAELMEVRMYARFGHSTYLCAAYEL
jgi:hypothetical protein